LVAVNTSARSVSQPGLREGEEILPAHPKRGKRFLLDMFLLDSGFCSAAPHLL